MDNIITYMKANKMKKEKNMKQKHMCSSTLNVYIIEQVGFMILPSMIVNATNKASNISTFIGANN